MAGSSGCEYREAGSQFEKSDSSKGLSIQKELVFAPGIESRLMMAPKLHIPES